jgi:hypothetical protein
VAKKASDRRRLSEFSVRELRAELDRRAQGVSRFERIRAQLLSKLKSVEAEIVDRGGAAVARVMGGARGGRRGVRRRPRNDMNLVEALRKLLNDRTMSVTEAAAKVQEAGYNTTSPNFRTIVNQTLINSGQFKRVSRGKYTAK